MEKLLMATFLHFKRYKTFYYLFSAYIYIYIYVCVCVCVCVHRLTDRLHADIQAVSPVLLLGNSTNAYIYQASSPKIMSWV
jgi:hypothetical protein